VKKNPIVIVLSSIPLALVTLSLLAIACVWGSTYPKPDQAIHYVFNTWWFMGLMGLLVVSLFFGTWEKSVAAVKLPWKKSFKRNPNFYHVMPHGLEFAAERSGDQIERELQKTYTIVRRREGSFFFQKGVLSRYGPTIIHIGLLIVIFSGAFKIICARNGWGIFGALVVIPESQAVDFYLVKKDPLGEFETGNIEGRDLGFTLRCLDFTEEKFPNSEVPRHFSSVLMASDPKTGEQAVQEINMTTPMYFKGIKFTQASFGPDDTVARSLFECVEAATGKRVALFDATPMEPVLVPKLNYYFMFTGLEQGGGWVLKNGDENVAAGLFAKSSAASTPVMIRVKRLIPDFRIDPGTSNVESASDEFRNAAIQVAYLENGETKAEDWAFMSSSAPPGMIPERHPDYKAVFVDYLPPKENYGKAAGQSVLDFYSVRVKVIRKKTGEAVFDEWVEIGRMVSVTAPTETAAGDASTSPVVAEAMGAGPYNVRFLGPTQGYQTVLGMLRDPSLPGIYAGVFIMLYGTFLSFLFVHRQGWACLDEENRKIRMALLIRGESKAPLGEYLSVARRLGYAGPEPGEFAAVKRPKKDVAGRKKELAREF